jgi:hypothetical protein
MSVSKFVKVSINMFGDNIDDHIYARIIQSLRKIDGGITSMNHSKGTNTIQVSAKWDESEFDNKMEAIRKIPNIKKLIVNKYKSVEVGIRESIKISDNVAWKIKSETAQKVSNIIDESIINKSTESNIKVRFLIFGPGKDSKEYVTHRLALKNMIQNNMHQIAKFPEDEKAKFGNAVIDEYFMMEDYDYTIILLMSIGSISEYSTFFIKEKVAHKIRLYVLKKHVRSKSYLSSGPITLFRKVHKQVYEFTKPEDLLVIAAEMVRDILSLRVISRI